MFSDCQFVRALCPNWSISDYTQKHDLGLQLIAFRNRLDLYYHNYWIPIFDILQLKCSCTTSPQSFPVGKFDWRANDFCGLFKDAKTGAQFARILVTNSSITMSGCKRPASNSQPELTTSTPDRTPTEAQRPRFAGLSSEELASTSAIVGSSMRCVNSDSGMYYNILYAISADHVSPEV